MNTDTTVEKIVADFFDRFPARNPDIEPLIKYWFRTTLTSFAEERDGEITRQIAEDLNRFSERYPEFGVRMIILDKGEYVFNTISVSDVLKTPPSDPTT